MYLTYVKNSKVLSAPFQELVFFLQQSGVR